WGIRTFHGLAALPEIGIAERLGAEGVRLQKLARGAGSRPLRPVEPELVFEQSLELEYPVTELEPLSFTLSLLLDQLCESLEARALSAIEIRMVLKLENQTEHARAIRLPVPMRDIRTLLKLQCPDIPHRDGQPDSARMLGLVFQLQHNSDLDGRQRACFEALAKLIEEQRQREGERLELRDRVLQLERLFEDQLRL